MNQHCFIMTQYLKVSTSTDLYWPSTIMYWPVPLSIDPVPPSANRYCLLLTQYHQVSTSTNIYCCCLGITDSCTVYPGSSFDIHHNYSESYSSPMFWYSSPAAFPDPRCVLPACLPPAQQSLFTWRSSISTFSPKFLAWHLRWEILRISSAPSSAHN